jgi:hypothetical protein
MTKIIIEVKGGLVTNVISNEHIEYVVVDWDNIEAGDEVPNETDFMDAEFVYNIYEPLVRYSIDQTLKNTEDE